MGGRCVDGKKCCKIIEQNAEVRSPIEIGLKAHMGEVELSCNGEPALVVTDCCDGCRLVVIQHINLRIPLYYEACVQALPSETTCAEDC